MEIIQTAEFWMAASAALSLVALFIPAPYRPILALIGKIIEAWPKKKLEPPAKIIPDPRPDPVQVMRDAEARFKEKGGEL